MFEKAIVVPIENESDYNRKLNSICKIAVAMARVGGINDKGMLLSSKGKPLTEAYSVIQYALGLINEPKHYEDFIFHYKKTKLDPDLIRKYKITEKKNSLKWMTF